MSECRGARREALRVARRALTDLPVNEYFELAGRPLLIYELLHYRKEADGARAAREDLPFLFKAFETGQGPPPRAGAETSLVDAPRAATIHEYLDWTVTAQEAASDEELDFGGFRVIVLLARFKPAWPPPGAFEEEGTRHCGRLGAPRAPLPPLMAGVGKAVCAATIRAGVGFMEVPFVATQETRRNRGFGRAMVAAIEEVARALRLSHLLLCSTDDPVVKATWLRLGFVCSSAADLEALRVQPGDLMHMDNTVQMHKAVPPPRPLQSIVLRHGAWRQRLYYAIPPPGSERLEGLPPPCCAPPLGSGPPKKTLNGRRRKRGRAGITAPRCKIGPAAAGSLSAGGAGSAPGTWMSASGLSHSLASGPGSSAAGPMASGAFSSGPGLEP